MDSVLEFDFSWLVSNYLSTFAALLFSNMGISMQSIPLLMAENSE